MYMTTTLVVIKYKFAHVYQMYFKTRENEFHMKCFNKISSAYSICKKDTKKVTSYFISEVMKKYESC